MKTVIRHRAQRDNTKVQTLHFQIELSFPLRRPLVNLKAALSKFIGVPEPNTRHAITKRNN